MSNARLVPMMYAGARLWAVTVVETLSAGTCEALLVAVNSAEPLLPWASLTACRHNPTASTKSQFRARRCFNPGHDLPMQWRRRSHAMYLYAGRHHQAEIPLSHLRPRGPS